MSDLPLVGITMGDPAGIGPEVAVKALLLRDIHTVCRPLVVGDAETIRRTAESLGAGLKVHSITDIKDAFSIPGTIDVFDLKNVDAAKLFPGKVSPMAGKAAYEAVEAVIQLALRGEVDATVTGPLNKEALNKAGYHYSGHTEIYAELTKTKNYTMLLVEGSLRVVHVTTHVSLRQACDLVTKERVMTVIRLAHEAMKNFGIEKPKIGVAGLNPHAGDGGLFGWEEEREIAPAVEASMAEGFNVEGPISADTVFSKARGGMYDIVVAMYHDQGHIPLKVVGFTWNEKENKWNSVSGINITLGLPIIRVSVDHGTAFEIAGKGLASAESMISAIRYAARFAEERTKRKNA